MAKRGLTAQQRLFALEYLVDRNATKAAVRAGYTEASAGTHGSRLLQNVEVQEVIRKSLEQATENAEVTLEQVIRELRRICLADPDDAIDHDTGAAKPLHEWPVDLRRALGGFEVKEVKSTTGSGEVVGHIRKFKFWSKTAAADQLMRHLGGFKKDNEQVSESLAELIHAAVGKGKK